MICLNILKAALAPPGAVLLYRSNHPLTSTAAIRSSGRALKAGSNYLFSAPSIPVRVLLL